jgi:hypothetical protein
LVWAPTNARVPANRRVISLSLGSTSSSECQCPWYHVSADQAFVSIAAGQNTTVILAKPTEKFSDMPRHPEEVDPPIVCVGCKKDYGEDDSPLECDKVRVYSFILTFDAQYSVVSSAMLRGTSSVSIHLSMQSQTGNGSAPTARTIPVRL